MGPKRKAEPVKTSNRGRKRNTTVSTDTSEKKTKTELEEEKKLKLEEPKKKNEELEEEDKKKQEVEEVNKKKQQLEKGKENKKEPVTSDDDDDDSEEESESDDSEAMCWSCGGEFDPTEPAFDPIDCYICGKMSHVDCASLRNSEYICDKCENESNSDDD